MHRACIIFFLSEATQQIAVFSDFFTKGEGTETILQLCLHLTNTLNYCFKTFSQKYLNPFLHFRDISLILLVDVSGHFYCMNMILPNQHSWRILYPYGSYGVLRKSCSPRPLTPAIWKATWSWTLNIRTVSTLLEQQGCWYIDSLIYLN